MNIIINETLIKRNAKIAQFSMIGGLIVLAGGMVLSFSPNYARYFYLSLLALLFGFILSQIGIYFTNRFGRRPRPDEQLNQALKGLDGKYSIYHYMTPVPHLLVGPSGVWILLPRSQKGRITFVNNRWKQIGGSIYMKIFAQESLGRPELDLVSDKEKLTQYFQNNLPEIEIPPIQAALVFTNPAVNIDIPEDADPPAVTVTGDKLKETVRKVAKSKPINQQTLEQIFDVLPDESK